VIYGCSVASVCVDSHWTEPSAGTRFRHSTHASSCSSASPHDTYIIMVDHFEVSLLDTTVEKLVNAGCVVTKTAQSTPRIGMYILTCPNCPNKLFRRQRDALRHLTKCVGTEWLCDPRPAGMCLRDGGGADQLRVHAHTPN
jgi:uncharacterized C2H2 Zn-finger protein